MHIIDSFLNAHTSVPLLGAAFVGVGHAFRQVRAAITEKVAVLKTKLAGEAGEGSTTRSVRRITDEGKRTVGRMAAVGSLIFAMQMVNFSIGMGASGHLLGGVLAALIVGPLPALLVMAVILFVQATLFSDGGLIALGANIVNMGVIGALGGFYIFRVLRKIAPIRIRIAVAAWLSVMFAALSATIQLATSGTGSFSALLPPMLTYHAMIGVGEALLTVGIISVLTRYRYPMFFSEGTDN